MIDAQLLELLACPVTKAPLQLNKPTKELVCLASKLAYPICDGIPVLLEEQARLMSDEEIANLRRR